MTTGAELGGPAARHQERRLLSAAAEVLAEVGPSAFTLERAALRAEESGGVPGFGQRVTPLRLGLRGAPRSALQAALA